MCWEMQRNKFLQPAALTCKNSVKKCTLAQIATLKKILLKKVLPAFLLEENFEF